MKNTMIKLLVGVVFSTAVAASAHAAFPDDFSDVNWIDPDVSGWPATSSLSVSIAGTNLNVPHTKRAVWPRRAGTQPGVCCNANLWVIAKINGRWHAATFEYLRGPENGGQVTKSTLAVGGGHVKRPPFLTSSYTWKPRNGEVVGFMVSGIARFGLANNNIRERSNVALYKWGVGPVDSIDEADPVPDPVEECVEPEPPAPVVNTHIYRGRATGQLVVTGANNDTATFDEAVTIRVSDDRSLTFTVDDESFNAQVKQDGSFSGKYTFDIGNAGICIVDINVSGLIDGKNASGVGSGSDSCAGNNATFNATFTASSSTAPSYLDQRPPVVLPRECGVPGMPSIVNMLLEDEPG